MAIAASAAFLLNYRLEIGFVADDWWFIRDRSFGGIDTLLMPHNEHVSVVPIAIYRLSFELFGITSAVPLQTLSLLVFLASVVALFIWVRDRVGEPAAALGSIAVLFMGTAYHDLLWTFQIGYSLSILGGLVALIALERDGHLARPVGCLALIVAVMSSSLGLPFLVGTAVLLIHRRGLSFWREYALLIPSVLFLAWYLFEGTKADNYASFENALGIPVFLFESLKAVTMGLTGIHALASPLDDVLGTVATVALILAVALYLWRGHSLPLHFRVGLAAGLTFWVLIALNQPGGIGRPADLSRYQYPGAVFLLMIMAGAFDGTRLRGKGTLVLATLVAVSVVAGLSPFAEGARQLRDGADLDRASITAMALAGDQTVPGAEVTLVPYFDYNLDRDQFVRIDSRYGLPEYPQGEIHELDETLKSSIDSNLVTLLGLGLVPGEEIRAGRCRTIQAGTERPAAVTGPGAVSFLAGNTATDVRASRYGSATVSLGVVPPGESRLLEIPPDESDEPWRIATSGENPVRVCWSFGTRPRE